MAGNSGQDFDPVEDTLIAQCSKSGEALTGWRSSEQVENGTPSTSPPYWDTEEQDDEGPKPSGLYGRHTWKIEKFLHINKRELRSDPFEIGGYKWYILVYPQGCDVCNHLSLFLCVANHDKLLPGWGHFAQFTIAVVNNKSKKSKYSDTLHRFKKKEHDWGWKKFMELSKVVDGFIDDDALTIKAQVQVISERVDRLFRCLDCQYRRDLVRVYLTNVEQICRRFVEERREKLVMLIDDKARWLSFRAFWLGIDPNTQRRMSKEKTDAIIKNVVKHFFIEKEVTSTLVMDSLYSGLKALKGQTKCIKGRNKLLDAAKIPAPMVCVDKETFVLVDDLLLLLERASIEPLPPQHEEVRQARPENGNLGEDFNNEPVEHIERRLTELGRRTVEIFVLTHIFSNKTEVAYQEAVAFRRQEELIREEEAEWLAENEQKAKREAQEKEKKTKKKQSKQKKNNRKGKEKGRDSFVIQEKPLDEEPSEKTNFIEYDPLLGKPNARYDISDVSDSVDGITESFPHDSEERDDSPVSWETDTSEVHHSTEAGSSGINGLAASVANVTDRMTPSVMDDSSSTCSTYSVPSVANTSTCSTYSVPSVANTSCNGSSFSNYHSKRSPIRIKHRYSRGTSNRVAWANEVDNQTSGSVIDAVDSNDASQSSKVGDSESVTPQSMHVQTKWVEQHSAENEKAVALQKTVGSKDADIFRCCKDPSKSLPKSSPPTIPSRSVPVPVEKSSHQNRKAASLLTSLLQNTPVLKLEAHNSKAAKQSEAPVLQQASPRSRPGPQPTPCVGSLIQTSALVARSINASPTSHSSAPAPQSYQNAIVGGLPSYSEPHVFSPERVDLNCGQSYNMMVTADVIHNHVNGEVSASTSDEFPHLDIINDLLDDEHGDHMNRQFPLQRRSAGTLPYANGHVDGVMLNQWQLTSFDRSLMGLRNMDADRYPFYSPSYTNLANGGNSYTIFQPSNGH